MLDTEPVFYLQVTQVSDSMMQFSDVVDSEVSESAEQSCNETNTV